MTMHASRSIVQGVESACGAEDTEWGMHLRGKTPNWSRPATLMPAMTRDLAESPSVRIRVHCSELRPPASLASSSFVRPACQNEQDFRCISELQKANSMQHCGLASNDERSTVET